MIDELSRELTLLEYMILGLIGSEPRTGYDIMSVLEGDAHRLSASPGSIYPALKRMEKNKLIAGQVEVVHETRPRKTYSITPLGETLLDRWVRSPLPVIGYREEFEVFMTRFLFTANRLTPNELIEWLDTCEKAIEQYNVPRRNFLEMLRSTAPIHQQLVWEAKLMELNMQREWVKIARERIHAEYQKQLISETNKQ
ncbi:MAG: PadR family transcriptional regulator [Anaerolineae bacterium]|nr:PadR family transcriptional regulator [Anaerolineae bacterium]